MRFTEIQLSLSTADEERAYFYGPTSTPEPDVTAVLPAGVYRVVEGNLCRVLPGLPPGFPVEPSIRQKRTV
jgi:hypothetical protein